MVVFSVRQLDGPGLSGPGLEVDVPDGGKVSDLKQAICGRIGDPPDGFRLISDGKALCPQRPLTAVGETVILIRYLEAGQPPVPTCLASVVCGAVELHWELGEQCQASRHPCRNESPCAYCGLLPYAAATFPVVSTPAQGCSITLNVLDFRWPTGAPICILDLEAEALGGCLRVVADDSGEVVPGVVKVATSPCVRARPTLQGLPLDYRNARHAGALTWCPSQPLEPATAYRMEVSEAQWPVQEGSLSPCLGVTVVRLTTAGSSTAAKTAATALNAATTA